MTLGARIYLAGPDVFMPDCRAIFKRLRAQCAALGLIGVTPFDGEQDTGRPGESDEARAQRIYEGNVRLLGGCDAVLANLAPFRGLEPDPGTVFEVGYAVALGKPVAAYGVPPGSYAERIGAALPCAPDGAGVLREVASGVMVEGLGQRLNLMLTRTCQIEPTPATALHWLAARLGPAPG